VLLFLAITFAPAYWGKLLILLLVATVAYVALRQWTINARQLRLERIQSGTVFSLARTLISIASGISLSILAFVLPGSHTILLSGVLSQCYRAFLSLRLLMVFTALRCVTSR
jgi:hypothetical protein